MSESLQGFISFHMNEQIEYASDDELYLVNPIGLLRSLRTPIRARCIKESIGIPINTWVYIDAIYTSQLFKIGYLINGNIHPYNHFQINISF